MTELGERKVVYCWDVPEYPCCGSCHTDWEYEEGEPMEREQADGVTTAGCCGFADWYAKNRVKNSGSEPVKTT